MKNMKNSNVGKPQKSLSNISRNGVGEVSHKWPELHTLKTGPGQETRETRYVLHDSWFGYACRH
jgi:hypothetical protein